MEKKTAGSWPVLVTLLVLLGLGALVTVGLWLALHHRGGPSRAAVTHRARAPLPQPPLPTPLLAPAGLTRVLAVSVVWDDSQKPAPGTTVTLTILPSSYQEVPSSGVSNAQGQLRLTFPQAWKHARLASRNPDALPEQRDLTLATAHDAVLRLKRAGRLFGTVRMAGGRWPVTGAEVLIAYPGDPNGQRSLKVKSDGRYEAVSLPAGGVNVAAFLGDFCSNMNQPEGAQATIRAGQRTGPVDLLLQPGASVVGWVRNKASGGPIAGVTIQADNIGGPIVPSTTTDLRGDYRLRYLPEQRVRMSASAEGYVMQGRLVEPRVAAESRCDFILEPGGEVEIRVADAAGKPIAGAGIGIWDWAGQYSKLPPAQTNDKGIALLHEISALSPPDIFPFKEGYERPPTLRLVFPAGKTRARVDFVMRPVRHGNGAFAGRVIDDKGTSLSGITLVWGTPQRPEDECATTSAGGSYHLEVKLERPDRQLTAFGKGWATQGKAGLTPGRPEAPLTVDFTMRPGHWLAGQVVDQQNNPLSAMNVTINSQAADAGNLTPGQRDLKTDSEGRFRSEDLPGGQAQVVVTDATTAQSQTTTTLVDREVRIVIKSPGVIAGRVLDKATQGPVRDFNIKVSNGGMWFGDRAMNGQSFSAADGRFKLVDLKQGERYALALDATGYATRTVPDILAEAPEGAKENQIELSGGTRIQGLLIEKGTLRPVADARIVYGFMPAAGWGPDWDAVERGGGWLRVIERQISRADGTFGINVDDDKETLYILPQKHRRVVIPAAKRTQYMEGDQMVIRLSPGASLAGQAFVDGAPAMSATVQLTSRAEEDPGAIGNQRTDNEGAYRWDNLDAGPYELSVTTRQSPPVYPCLARRCALKEEEQKTLNIGDDLGGASLAGAVLDHGNPVANVVVTLRPLFDWDYTLLAGHSDEEGIYIIQGLRPGRYRAELSGHPPKNIEETVEVRGQTQHDFEFQQGHVLTARLVFAEGFSPDLRARLQSATLSANAFSTSPAGDEEIDGSGSSPIQGDRLRYEGRFKGPYRIALEFSGQPSGSSIALPGPFELDTLEADQDLGDIPVQATGDLLVRLAFGAQPPAGVGALTNFILFVLPEDGNANSVAGAGGGAQLNLDPARPEQTVGPIGVGNQRLLPFAFGYRADPSNPTVAIEPGKVAGPLTFTLTPEGMIVGIAKGKPASGAADSKMIQPSRITLNGQGLVRTLVPRNSPNVDLAAMVNEAMSGKDWAVGPVFEFRDLKQGTYQVSIEAPGYQTLTAPKEATPGQLNLSAMELTPLGQ